MIIFETARLIVRHFTMADLPDFHRLSSDEKLMHFIGPVLSHGECSSILEEIIKAYRKNNFLGRFAVIERDTGQYAGNFLLRNAWDGSGTEVGFALLEPAQGRGYATELTLQGCSLAFEQLRATRLFGTVDSRNQASLRVLAKCGFSNGVPYPEDGRLLVTCERLLPVPAVPYTPV